MLNGFRIEKLAPLTGVIMAVGLLTPIFWLVEGLSLVWIVVVSIWLYAGEPRSDHLGDPGELQRSP